MITRFLLAGLLVLQYCPARAQEAIPGIGGRKVFPGNAFIKFYPEAGGGSWVSLFTLDSITRWYVDAKGKPGPRFTQYPVKNDPDGAAAPGAMNAGILNFMFNRYINGYVSNGKMVEMYAQKQNRDMMVYVTDLATGASGIAASAVFDANETLFTHFNCGDTFYLLSHVELTNKARIYYYAPGQPHIRYREQDITHKALMAGDPGLFTTTASFSSFLKKNFQVFKESDGLAFPTAYTGSKKAFVQSDGHIRFIFRDDADSAAVLSINVHDFSYKVSVFHMRQYLPETGSVKTNSCIAGPVLTKYYIFKKDGTERLLLANCHLATGVVNVSDVLSGADSAVLGSQAIRKVNYIKKRGERVQVKNAGDLLDEMIRHGGFITTETAAGGGLKVSLGSIVVKEASTAGIIASVLLSGLLTYGINAPPSMAGYGIVIIKIPSAWEISFHGWLSEDLKTIAASRVHPGPAMLSLVDFLKNNPFLPDTLEGCRLPDGRTLFSVYNGRKKTFQLYEFPF